MINENVHHIIHTVDSSSRVGAESCMYVQVNELHRLKVNFRVKQLDWSVASFKANPPPQIFIMYHILNQFQLQSWLQFICT